MIGERLEEARKRRTISIREAAEATKIRGDFLMAMEDNTFEIDLPEIYIRGFLKNYAKFLKLDPQKILTDYDAQMLGKAAAVRERAANSSRESFGRMEIQDEEEEESKVSTSTLNPPRRSPSPPPPTLENEGTRRDEQDWADSKALYFKIGVIFGGLLIVGIILVILLRLVMGGDKPEINPEISNTTTNTQTATPQSTNSASSSDASVSETIVLQASDNVTVIVEQTLDRERLYSGSLNAGDTISVEKQGPVSIRFTNGAALTIEKNGQQMRLGQAGVGRTVVP